MHDALINTMIDIFKHQLRRTSQKVKKDKKSQEERAIRLTDPLVSMSEISNGAEAAQRNATTSGINVVFPDATGLPKKHRKKPVASKFPEPTRINSNIPTKICWIKYSY